MEFVCLINFVHYRVEFIPCTFIPVDFVIGYRVFTKNVFCNVTTVCTHMFWYNFGRPEDLHRIRVEHMERQLANLTGLVQKALVNQNPQIAPMAVPTLDSNYLVVPSQIQGRRIFKFKYMWSPFVPYNTMLSFYICNMELNLLSNTQVQFVTASLCFIKFIRSLPLPLQMT